MLNPNFLSNFQFLQENADLHTSSTKELEATIERLQAALDSQNRLKRPVGGSEKELPALPRFVKLHCRSSHRLLFPLPFLPCFSAQESDVGDDVIKSLREALVEKDKFIQVKLTSK